MLSGTESRTFRGKKKGEKKGPSPPHIRSDNYCCMRKGGTNMNVKEEKRRKRGSKSGKNGKKNKN